jgi:hypothetical protein
MDLVRTLVQLLNDSLQELGANKEDSRKLQNSIQALHESILRPVLLAQGQAGFEVSNALKERIDRLNT